MVYLFLNLIYQFTSPFDHDSKELSTLELLGSNLHSIIPNADNQYNIFNLHLLKQMEELLTSTVFTIVIKAFSHDITLRDLIELRHPVRQ